MNAQPVDVLGVLYGLDCYLGAKMIQSIQRGEKASRKAAEKGAHPDAHPEVRIATERLYYLRDELRNVIAAFEGDAAWAAAVDVAELIDAAKLFNFIPLEHLSDDANCVITVKAGDLRRLVAAVAVCGGTP